MTYVDMLIEQRYHIPYPVVEEWVGRADDGSAEWVHDAREAIFLAPEEELDKFNVNGEIFLDL